MLRLVQAGADRSEHGPGDITVHIQLGHGLDVEQYRARFARGLEPDETPYGFHEAEQFGYRLTWSQDHSRSFLTSFLAKAIRRLFGFDIVQAWCNRKLAGAADVIWCMLEGEALALSALMKMGLMTRRPIVTSIVWMVNSWPQYWAPRRAMYRWLSRNWDGVFVHAQASLDPARRCLPDRHVELLHFGVAEGTFLRRPEPRAPGRPLHIVATGNDVTRDFDTVLAAFGNDPRFRLTLLTRHVSAAEAARYSNVEVPEISGMTDFKAWYLDADYVCIPLHENRYSGITVALEAAAIGAPVVCSHTGGVPTYFDEREVLYVGVGDPEDLRQRVLEQTSDARHEMALRANRRFVQCDYTTRGMMKHYAARTAAILGGAKPDSAGRAGDQRTARSGV